MYKNLTTEQLKQILGDLKVKEQYISQDIRDEMKRVIKEKLKIT